MTILITGGRGQTGSILSRLLKEANKSVLIASRSGTAPSPYKAVHFDWFDDKTFNSPFKVDSDIDRVYIILPAVINRFAIVKPFIDLAVSKGVKRFVILNATQPSPTMGDVHKYLSDIKVDYTMLSPSWFQQNFGSLYYNSILDQNELFGVGEDGRVPFVSIEDIAQAAYDALVSEKSPNKDLYIVGPQLFSYDEVAELLTDILGRKITFRRLSGDEHKKILSSFLSPEYAEWLVSVESKIANGVEEAAFNVEEDQKFVGKHSLREYLEANRDIWVKQ